MRDTKDRQSVALQSFWESSPTLVNNLFPLIWEKRSDQYYKRLDERVNTIISIISDNRYIWKDLDFDDIYTELFEECIVTNVEEDTGERLDLIGEIFLDNEDEYGSKKNKEFSIIYRNAMWIFCKDLVKFLQEKIFLNDLKETLLKITDLGYVRSYNKKHEMLLWFRDNNGYDYEYIHRIYGDLLG